MNRFCLISALTKIEYSLGESRSQLQSQSFHQETQYQPTFHKIKAIGCQILKVNFRSLKIILFEMLNVEIKKKTTVLTKQEHCINKSRKLNSRERFSHTIWQWWKHLKKKCQSSSWWNKYFWGYCSLICLRKPSKTADLFDKNWMISRKGRLLLLSSDGFRKVLVLFWECVIQSQHAENNREEWQRRHRNLKNNAWAEVYQIIKFKNSRNIHKTKASMLNKNGHVL